MKFSVLMSLYIKERPEYLYEALESLEKQTLPANEIVIVFDGKITKELENVVDSFMHRLPITILRLSENLGLGKALNKGLLQCKNEWVFRMDTDDICLAERFEKQVNFIKTHPEIAILGGQIAEFGQNIDDIVSYRYVPTEYSDIVKFTRKRCPFNHMTVAYQKSIVLSCGGYQDLQEDYYLWIKLIGQGYKVANLVDLLVYARVGNGMVGRRRGVAQAKAEWRIFKLKQKLKFHTPIFGLLIFLMRSLPRLLPISLLSIIYQLTRKNKLK